MKCTSCGALVVAAPVPVAPAVAPSVAPPPLSSAMDPWGTFARTDDPMAGVLVRPAPAPPKSSAGRPIGMVVAGVIVVLALGAAAYPMLHPNAAVVDGPPVVLTPNEPMAGGVPGLSEAVRVQAESNRQTAFGAIMRLRSNADGTFDRAMLQQAQPDFTWLDASESSTEPKEVSLDDSTDVAVIAISASNKHICAFGRLPLDGVAEYVTMGNMKSCAATDAPEEGWSQLAGGYGGTPPLDP
jgi:hypothetical protein